MRTRWLGVLAGLLVAVFVLALVRPSTVPTEIVTLLGGPTEIERNGGWRIVFKSGTTTTEKDFVGISESEGEKLVDMLQGGGLHFHEVLERTNTLIDLSLLDPSLTYDVDLWRAEDTGEKHQTGYLMSPSRERLEQALPKSPDSFFALEYIEAHDSWRADTRGQWRTYELANASTVDGGMIANATKSYDPYSNRPTVLVDFTREGAEKFCEVTGRVAGHKLAIVLGGKVRSAPIINSRICGGRASITMGNGNVADMEREADTVVTVLRTGALPDDLHVVKHWYFKPRGARSAGIAAVAIIAFLAFALTAIIVGVVLGFAKSETPERAWTKLAWKKFPLRRTIVTLLLGPIALFLGAKFVELPGVNHYEWTHMTRDGGSLGVFELGITPIISTFILVELVALAIPRLRWRRHDPKGRIRLGQAVAIGAALVAFVQGYFVSIYLEALSWGSAEIVSHPGMSFRLMTALTLATGTLVLAVLAGMIREHGLGNGYGVLLASGVLMRVVDLAPHFEPSAVIAVPVIATATMFVLRRRVGGMRLPTSGVSPIGDSVALLALAAMLAAFGMDPNLRAKAVLENPLVHVVVVTAMTFAWAWVFARPSVIQNVAMQSGYATPSTRTWVQATVLSAVYCIAVGLVGWLAHVEAMTIAVATAVIVDVVDDARMRGRGELAPVAVLHQVQRIPIIEHVLAAKGIPVHWHGSNLRSLLAFFGPWAPVVAYVPVDAAEQARAAIRDATTEARTTVPPARVAG